MACIVLLITAGFISFFFLDIPREPEQPNRLTRMDKPEKLPLRSPPTNVQPIKPLPLPPPQPATSAPPQVARTNTPLLSSTQTVARVLPQQVTPAIMQAFPRPVQTVLEAQIVLARQGISSGSIDGLMGPQTSAALVAFQREQALPASGELNQATRELLLLDRKPTITYTVSSNDLARLRPISPTWLGKSQQDALEYENLLELVSETRRSHPNLIRNLNKNVDWSNIHEGTELLVPDAEMTECRMDAAFIAISLKSRTLEVFDFQTNLIAHFPCSIAQRVEKRPAGELYITAIASDPNYTFRPEVFPESEEARGLGRKLILPPGPNNPVGVAWISLSKPGYGIHGTPAPEQVGRTESHGCFRLANWNARHLLKLVKTGMPVYVE